MMNDHIQIPRPDAQLLLQLLDAQCRQGLPGGLEQAAATVDAARALQAALAAGEATGTETKGGEG